MTYVRKRKSIFARSVWVMLSVFFALLTVVFSVGSSIAADNAAPINKTLGAESSIRVQVGGGSGEVVDHYPSAFIERYADGSPIYQVDEYGNKTTIMDDEPMRENSQKIAEQTAVEGTVLLWNDNDTLPLAEGSRVSLFGIASAKGKYALSGYGSGKVDAIPTDGSLAAALEKKGFAVNKTLDEKYESLTDSSIFDGNFNYGLHQGSWNGDRNYKPVYCVNEVPWSVIGQTATETVNGDTAVMVVSRRAGEDPWVRLARLSLETWVRQGRPLQALPADLPAELTDRAAGTFVSLHKGGRLRGCIGTIAPTAETVAQEIVQNAVSAGTRDPRFPPVRAGELDDLEYSVDVLGTPEPVDSTDQLDPKRYGVIVSYGCKRGLLLPDLDGVDTVEEQLDIARRKGGIREEDPCAIERFKVVRHL